MTQAKAQVFSKALNQAYIDKNFRQVNEIILDSGEVSNSEYETELWKWLYDNYSYGTNGNSVQGVPILLACRSLVEKSLENLDLSEAVLMLKEWESKLDGISGKIDNILISSRYISEPPSTLIRVIFHIAESALYLRFPFQQDNIVRFYNAFRDALDIISGESHLAENKEQTLPEIPVNDGEKSIIADSLRYFSFLYKPRYIAFCSHILHWLLNSEPQVENSSTVTFPYFREFEGKTALIRLELHGNGTGEIFPHPVRSPFLRYDREAENCLKNIREFVSGLPELKGRIQNYNISFEIMEKSPRYPLKNITDISFGAAFATGVKNLSGGSPIDTDCCISAGIDRSGKLLPVSHIPEKIDAAIKAKMRKFVLCSENYEKVKDEFPDSKIQLIPASRMEEVTQTATGLTETVDNYLDNLEKNLRILPKYYPAGYEVEKLAVNLILIERGAGTDKDGKRKYPLSFNWNDEIFYRNIILSGPGCGKSWLLKHLSIKLLKKLTREIREAHGSLYDVDLPVFLRLGDIASRLDESSDFAETLIGLTVQKYFSGGNDVEFRNFIREKLRNNNLFLLLDALDEVDSKKIALLRKHLDEFCRKYHLCPIVITSRNTGFQTFPEELRFEEMEIQKLNDEQILDFIGNWFRKNNETQRDVESEESYSQQIFGEFRSISAVRDLVRVPLFLSFLCKFREEGSLQNIRRRRDVFEKALWGLLTHWRSEKTYDEIGTAEINFMLRVLESTAYRMFTGERDQIDREDLLELIEESAEEPVESHKRDKTKGLRLPAKFKTWKKEDMLAENLLDEFIRTGILVKSGAMGQSGEGRRSGSVTNTGSPLSDGFMFIHRSFLEYLTTSHIARKPDWMEELKQHFKDSRWEEIITMMAGFYGESGNSGNAAFKCNSDNAFKLVNAIISYSDKVVDENHYLELLAGKCFIEWDEEFRQIPEVNEVFSGHINRMFETVQSIKEVESKENRDKILETYIIVMASIRGDFIVNYIFEKNNNFQLPLEYYRILGEMGTNSAIDAMIKLIKMKTEYDEKRINQKDRLNYLERIDLFDQMGLYLDCIGPQFTMGDIINWEEFMVRLKNSKSEIEKQILLLLNHKVKEMINSFSPGKELKFDEKKEIIDGLNELLESEELPEKASYLIENYEKGKESANEEIKALSFEKLLSYNRSLLESIFPSEITKSSMEANLSFIDFEFIMQLDRYIDNPKVKNLLESMIKTGGLLSWGISWFVLRLFFNKAEGFYRSWITLIDNPENVLEKSIFLIPANNNLYSFIPKLQELLHHKDVIIRNRASIILAYFGVKPVKTLLLDSLLKGHLCKVSDHDGDNRSLENVDYEILLDSLSQIQCEELSMIIVEILSGKSIGEENSVIQNRFRDSILRSYKLEELSPRFREPIADAILEITAIRTLAMTGNQETLKAINIEKIEDRFKNKYQEIIAEVLLDYLNSALGKMKLRIKVKERLKQFYELFYREIKPYNDKYGVDIGDNYSIIKPLQTIYDAVKRIIFGLSSIENDLQKVDCFKIEQFRETNEMTDNNELSAKNIIMEIIESLMLKESNSQSYKASMAFPVDNLKIKNASLKLLDILKNSEELKKEIQSIIFDCEQDSIEFAIACRNEISWHLASKLSLSDDHYPFLQDLIKLLRDENITVRNFAREIYEFIR